jgi:hypothetical protein
VDLATRHSSVGDLYVFAVEQRDDRAVGKQGNALDASPEKQIVELRAPDASRVEADRASRPKARRKGECAGSTLIEIDPADA